MEITNIAEIQDAIISVLPNTVANHGEAPDPRFVYVPSAHVKALRLDATLVVGARGVGKSFWTAALTSQSLHASLGQTIREINTVEVRKGFSNTPNIAHYPDSAVFDQLLKKGCQPDIIWRSVVARWIADILQREVPRANWPETIRWVEEEPEALAQMMEQANRQLTDRGMYALIVFDALDRTSHNWGTMDAIVRDLLRVSLWLKSYQRLQAKIFLREDQIDRSVTDFPDASKILSTKVDLTWAPHDLHGLLWQYLCNAEGSHGEILRSIYQSMINEPISDNNGVWFLNNLAKREGGTQRELFHRLTGPWMGNDARRGIPYVWSVGHLADGNGRTSPRSFLAAIRAAAEDSQDKYPDHRYALHYESIKRGVQKASQIRVDEMAEDYPWVRECLRKLKGLVVPCEYNLIIDRWKQNFPDGYPNTEGDKLPPQHAEGGWSGITEDLKRLGIFLIKKDERIDMPDLYRVGFGLGRRGGVKPIKYPSWSS